jgi:hypothetical protein
MKTDETTLPPAGEAKSPAAPDAPKSEPMAWQKNFAKLVEGWKKEGCAAVIDAGTDKERFCGGKPHLTKMGKPEGGRIPITVNCTEGHEDAWKTDISEADVQADFARQKEAAAAAQAERIKDKDPMKASVTITLDLKTQEFDIDAWVPTPGLGLQLAAVLTSHFSQMLMASKLMERPKILTAPKGIIDPKTGKPFVQ